ncbi:hypothetical protein L580_0735 [Serratia fonticola AU-P3(3)]|nr:hypothetical protein L580_0735 [Serratia fonticola AU-P3(3)]
MFKVYKTTDSQDKYVEFTYLEVTYGQLAQLAQLSRGQSLFDCTILHSAYGLADSYGPSLVPANRPLPDYRQYQLVFSYYGKCYGIVAAVKTGGKPFQSTQSTAIAKVYEVAKGREFKTEDVQYVISVEPFFLRAYP